MKKRWARAALSAALVGSMVLGSTMSSYAWTTSNEVSDREEASAAISLEAAGEGMVLLENNGTLPVAKDSKIVVYGGGALATIKGGTGSGDVNQRTVINAYDGLSEVYNIANEDYWEPYLHDWALAQAGELTQSTEYVNVERSWFSYTYSINESLIDDAEFRSQQDIDCAFYVVSRISGEGADRQNVQEGDGDYYLSDIERANIDELAHYYNKVVVILNTANVIDTKFVNEINEKYPDGIDSVLLMGQAGMYGGRALAQVLDGERNPSGKLVDTWPVDYMDFPSSATLGENIVDSRTEYDEYYYDDIYVGYRYFDTFNVTPAYEFGFGLSYTTFEQEIVGFQADADNVTIGVRVTNTGDTYAGKEVVEVYFSAPDGALEKPYQELIAYGKTDELKPGESQIMTLSFTTDEMSSYSEELAAYLMEDGDYVIRVGNSSRNTHVAGVVALDEDTITEQLSNQMTIEEGKEEILNEGKLSNEGVTPYSYEGEAEEIASAQRVSLSKEDFGEAANNASTAEDENVVTYYSSNDANADSAKYAAKGGWLTANSTEETLVPVETDNEWTLLDVYNGRITMEQFVAGLSIDQLSWIVNGVDVGTASTAGTGQLGTFQYRDADSFVYTDAEGNETREGGSTLGWTALYTSGTVWASTPNYYNTLLIPSTDLSDGPAGARITRTGTKTLYELVSPVEVAQNEDGDYYVAKEAEFNVMENETYYQYATAFPVGALLAQTWNQELLERVGQAYGDEYEEFEMTYILGPGMNIHRTPLCGRNFEYYSEDPLVTGFTASSFTKGMQSKDGVGVTLKHFAGNNNETYRNYVNDVVSERALREIYLKGFEIAVKSAAPMAIMTSYNLINGQRTVNSYDLNTDILKNEWGFEGAVMSDYGAANRAQANEELGLNMWANIMHSGNDWIMGGSTQSLTGTASFASLLKVDSLETPEMALGDLQDSAISILTSVMRSNMFGDKMADYVDTDFVSAEEIAELQQIHNGSYTALFEDSLKTYATVSKRDASTPGGSEGDKDMVDTALSRVIAMIEGLDSSKYTQASWAEVAEALAAAKEVNVESATQAELDAALNSLLKAFGNLEYGVQKLHLEIALEAAEKILPSIGSYEGGENLEAVVEAGRTVLENNNATQSEVDQAAYAILDELSKLAKNANVASLESLIDAAETLMEGNYTQSSLNDLQAAIDNAKAVIADENRGENDISDAFTEIIDAIMNLQLKGNKAALRAVIVKANEILASADIYVASTISGLDAILANARAVYNNDNATQSMVDSAVESLTLKLTEARLVGDVDGNGAVTTSDSVSLLKYSAEMSDLDKTSRECADVNGDGVADTKDAALILQYAAEKIAAF